MAIVIGGGPAGLMAAQELAAAGLSVRVFDAKPTFGRKFLMAGRSGLNLTKDEPTNEFLIRYGDAKDRLKPMIEEFDPMDVQTWAKDLGQDVFTGSSGRVFPKAMKASPLLRAWILQLSGMGVQFHPRWRWTGWRGENLSFETPDGPKDLTSDVTVLALGGASWRRLGSDGGWADILRQKGVDCVAFQPANAGLAINWSDPMRRHFGTPVKAIAFRSGEFFERGECVISSRGLEGSGIYGMTPLARTGDRIDIDLLPDRSVEDIASRLDNPRRGETLSNQLRKRLKLGPEKIALLQEFARPLPKGRDLAPIIKALPIRYDGLRPIDEAISVAGGVSWQAVDSDLMLRELPGVFVAGEMLNWEAPTGGYLLNGCFASGRWAGRRAAMRVTATSQ